MTITKPHFSDSFGLKFFKKVFLPLNIYIFFSIPLATFVRIFVLPHTARR